MLILKHILIFKLFSVDGFLKAEMHMVRIFGSGMMILEGNVLNARPLVAAVPKLPLFVAMLLRRNRKARKVKDTNSRCKNTICKVCFFSIASRLAKKGIEEQDKAIIATSKLLLGKHRQHSSLWLSGPLASDKVEEVATGGGS